MVRTEFFDNKSREVEGRPSIAVGLAIVGIDPGINGENESNLILWTIIDKTTRQETGRIAGQIGIPFESRKSKESLLNNVLGGLDEIWCDDDLPNVRKHLYIGSLCEGKTMHKYGPVDLAIIIYNGSLDIKFSPLCKEEAIPNGWIRLENLQNMENVRPMARQLIDASQKEDLFRPAINMWRFYPESKKLLIPEGFSIGDFTKARNRCDDIVTIFKTN